MAFNNKHAIVTGGGSGVGAAIALKLAEDNAKVTILGRRDKPLIETASKHKNIDWKVCDVTNADDLEQSYNLIRKKVGKINIVIANAGKAFSKPFNKMSSKDISSIMDVNLIGVFNSFKYASKDMESEGWGRMIAISSTAGLKGYSYVSAYCASKHAVIGLTKSLSIELAKKGITVNSIFVKLFFSSKIFEDIKSKIYSGIRFLYVLFKILNASPFSSTSEIVVDT